MKSDQDRLKTLLIETVKTFLKDGVERHNTLAVEGLIGITLDNKDVFLVYVNECSTGEVGRTAVNDDPCSRDRFDVLDKCDTNWEHSCADATGSTVSHHETHVTHQVHSKNSDTDSSETTAVGNLQNVDFDASTMQQLISGCENNQRSTMAGRARCDVDDDSQCANTPSFSGYFDEAADDVKPLVIVSYWSEAATQEADFGRPIDQGETAIPRATEGECRTNLSHVNPLLTPTPAEQRSGIKNVVEKANGRRDRKSCKRRQLCENEDLLNGDSDKRLTRSAKLKLDQHRTSGNGQSTRRLNKGHLCTVCNKVFSQRCQLVCHKLKHNTSSGEKSTKGNACYCDICGRGFVHNSKIKRHMRAHTGVKPYTCTVCSSAFGEYGNLTRHMRTHTGEKPYACKECNKAFSRSTSLTRHMHTHGKKS